jgi:dethiobiotin synthetase
VTDLAVVGTDTGVGKTVIAAALLLAWREHGLKVVGFKPIESGVVSGEPTDAEVLAKASGRNEPLATPLLRLAEPLAPALAAERAGRSLGRSAIDERIVALRGAGYRIAIEGAGGALVPLVWGCTILDLAQTHRLEAVIVGRAGLGTLNHVALTAEALRARAIPLRGIVLNARASVPTLAEETNPGALARLAPGVPITVVPRHASADALDAAYATVPLVANLVRD